MPTIAYPYRFSDWYGYDKDCAARIEVNIALGVPDNSGSFCNTIQTTCWFEQASGNTGIYPQATNGGDVCYTSQTGSTKLFGGTGTNYSYGPNQISNPVGFFRILGPTGTVQGTGTCP